MSIQKYYDSESTYNLSPEFQQHLQHIKPDVDEMLSSEKQFKHARMRVIGQLTEYSRQFPERSDDRRAIREMLGQWTQDQIDSSYSAYKTYQELKGNVNPEYQKLAEASNPTQLMLLGRSEDKSIQYDAAMAFKKTGKVPTVQDLKGRLGGHKDSSFQSRFKPELKPQQPVVTQPVERPVYVAPTPEELEFQRSTNMSEGRLQHIRSLMANEDLPHINNAHKALIWNATNQELLDVVQQKCEIDPSYIIRIEALIQRLKEPTDVVETEATQISERDWLLSQHPRDLNPDQRSKRSMIMLGRY